MFFKVAIPVAVLTASALVYGLVQMERTAPLSEKPSIRLRVWTGDLPSADLAKVLADTTASVEAAGAAHEKAVLAKAAQAEVTQVGEELLQKLGERIAEKQASEWAGTTVSR